MNENHSAFPTAQGLMVFGILGRSPMNPPRLLQLLHCTGIEDKYLNEVPGTGLLSDLGTIHGIQVTINEATNLKRGTGRHAHVVLMPQPSDDPRDPCVMIERRVLQSLKTFVRLNWPQWRKDACFWTL